MKKKVLYILSIILIIAGGYFTMEYLERKEAQEKFWKEQETRIEKYIHYNIKDVKSITFTKHDINPMGVPTIKGYINNDKGLDFLASVTTTENFEGDFTRSQRLDKMMKKPVKPVSEIEKAKKE